MSSTKAPCRAQSHSPEIMTWAQTESQALNKLSLSEPQCGSLFKNVSSMLPFHMSSLSPTFLSVYKCPYLWIIFCVFISFYWFIFLSLGHIFLFPCPVPSLYQTPDIVNFTLLNAAYFCHPISIFQLYSWSQLSYSEMVWPFQSLSLWLIVPHHSKYHFDSFAKSMVFHSG